MRSVRLALGAGSFAIRAVGWTIRWSLMLGALAIVATVIAIGVSIGTGVRDSNKMSSRVTPLMSRVHLGESERQVRALLGKPDSTQQEVDATGVTDLWYYGTLSTKAWWQLVFENGRLVDKNRN